MLSQVANYSHQSSTLDDVLILSQARFPFKRNRLRCVNENRKKRKRLRWQAANHGATASTEHSHWLALAFVA